MQEMPLVSVIIPTLNSEKYIKRCLLALTLQTYKNFEVIIIDAKSEDQTIAIIESFKTQLRIHLAVLEKSTQSEARNLGLKTAQGKYIVFCDADDFYLADKIALQVQLMEENNIDVSYFDPLHFHTHQNKLFINHHSENKDMLAACLKQQVVNLSSLMVKKNFLDKNNIHFPLGVMGRFGEDWNFVLQLALQHAKFKKLIAHLSVVEVRQDSHTQWEAQWLMKHYAIKFLIAALPKLNPYYQEIVTETITKLKVKLVIAYVVAKKFAQAKLALKNLPQYNLFGSANILFFILRFIPSKIMIALWNKYRIHKRYIYPPINAEIKTQVDSILKFTL